MKILAIKTSAYSILVAVYLGIWVLYFRAISHVTVLTINAGFLATFLATLTVLIFHTFPGPRMQCYSKLIRFIKIDLFGLGIFLLALGVAFLFAIPAINDRSLSIYLTSTVANNQNGIELNELENFINGDWNRENRQLKRRIEENVEIGNFYTSKDGKILCPSNQLLAFSKFNLLFSKALGLDLSYVTGSDLLKTKISAKANQC